MGNTVPNQSCIHEEIKNGFNSGNASCHCVQNLLCSRLLPKKLNPKIKKKNMILLVALNGSEAWSHTLREEQRLRLFENRVLRRIYGPKKEEVKGVWKRLHSEELHNLYASPDIIRVIKSRRMRWVEHVARMGARSMKFWTENLKGEFDGRFKGRRG